MSNQYAENFYEIPTILATSDNLRQVIIALIKNEPIPGKVLEDSNGSRLEVFRGILTGLTNGDIDLAHAFQQTPEKLPRQTSPHSSNNRVFSHRWEERLVIPN